MIMYGRWIHCIVIWFHFVVIRYILNCMFILCQTKALWLIVRKYPIATAIGWNGGGNMKSLFYYAARPPISTSRSDERPTWTWFGHIIHRKAVTFVITSCNTLLSSVPSAAQPFLKCAVWCVDSYKSIASTLLSRSYGIDWFMKWLIRFQ